MAQVQILTDSNFSTETVKGYVLVDFFAAWCGPCRMLAPILEKIAKNNEGKVAVKKLDIDSEQKTAARFQVTSVPTMVLFKDGKEVNRLIGLRDLDSIQSFLDSSLS